MTCGKCGAPTTRARLCKACALDKRYSTGPVGGTASDDEDKSEAEEVDE